MRSSRDCTPEKPRRNRYITLITAFRCTYRPAENGVEASLGSVEDCYDNVLAETDIGFFKTEVIYARSVPVSRRR